MKIAILVLIFSLFLSGCGQPQVRYETFSKTATSEEMCLQIANDSFDKVCNEVLKDKGYCLKVWDASIIQFDAAKNQCFLSFPVGG